MISLHGKVALVTGAGRGLGRAMAEVLAEAGARVTVAARTAAQLESFVAEQGEYGREALAVPTDVTDEHAVEGMIEATVERFGRVDILVNNSGVISTSPLIEQEPDEWDRVVTTNLRGVYLTTRAVGRHFVVQQSGKVINIASNFALKSVAQHAAYSASKAGVLAFTRSMAVEWARYGIQVNAIAPGYFATDLNAEMRADPQLFDRVVRAIPARRMGEAVEIKPWLLLLASDASNFMTGESIVLDGGQAVR